VDCPKCRFALAGPAESCPRCGVVFSKLGSPRPERRPAPRTPPPAPPPEEARPASLVNILLLSVLLSVTGAFLWQRYRPEPPEEPAAGERRPAREIVVEVPPPPDGSAFVLPAPAQPSGTPVGAAPSAPPPSAPELPELNQNTVSMALVERAEQLSREFPDAKGIRDYVAAAYLLLAGNEMRRNRSSDALRMIDHAEEWGAAKDQTATFRAMVFDAEEEWEPAEKWARAALAYGARANAADMHHVIGKAHYFREELEKAIAEFEIALSLRNDPEIRASLERARQEARASEGFDRRRLAHFIVMYEGDTMESTGRMVLDTMERSYATLVSQMGFEPAEPVVVVLYSRRSYREMGGPHWSAGLFDGKIRVPVRGLERLDESIRSTLHHELTHAFVHSRAGDATPRWLNEGVAEYMEGTRTAKTGNVLAEYLSDGNSLEHCVATAQCDLRVFYPAAASMVDYLVQVRGLPGISETLLALGEGNDIDTSLRRVFGRDQAELIREWEHFVKRRFG
jgi:tetratricopeptide (TPR) repeat protein